MSLIFILIFYIFGIDIAMLYTNNIAIIKVVKKLLFLISISPLISVSSYIWDGIFIAITASRYMRDSVIISTIIYIAIFYLFKDYNYSLILWSSFLLFFFFRGLIQTIQFLKFSKSPYYLGN